jgi:hypothetical protein
MNSDQSTDKWLEATSNGFQIPLRDLLDPAKSTAIHAYCSWLQIKVQIRICATIDRRLSALSTDLERLAAATDPETATAFDSFRLRLCNAAIELERLRSSEAASASRPTVDTEADPSLDEEMGRWVQALIDDAPYVKRWSR